MIDFRPIELNDRPIYNQYLYQNAPKGCEYSFANLFMWGLQDICFLHNHVILYSQYNNRCFYPFPIGSGDKTLVLNSIFLDAKERGVCPCMTGLNEEDKKILESLYPNQFYFHEERSGFDYIYDIHHLADLKGRKLHRKRNHLKHFKKQHPDYRITPITPKNIERVEAFAADWYKLKLENNPDGDYHNEQAALKKVFQYYSDLEMEGILLEEHNEILGFTMGSLMYPDTLDIHYEKARGDIDGAYTTINSEFANYIRTKHPHIKYFNREEDMGIAGLRKAKMSYFPDHFIKKYSALPLRFSYNFVKPSLNMIPKLRLLWKEAFGDSEEFLDKFYSTAFDTKRCRIAQIDNINSTESEIAAVLYWFDCTLDGQRIAYLYAVATAKEFRGEGACHKLLEDTHRHLKSLGYVGVILVPGNDNLVKLYEGCGYELCTKRSTIICTAENRNVGIREIDKTEFSSLRKEFLPPHAVIQENENIDFLETEFKFYTGNDFLLAAKTNNHKLFGIELLGDTSVAPGILSTLNCTEGTFYIPGKEEHFGMYHPLVQEIEAPSYFGFAFDS